MSKSKSKTSPVQFKNKYVDRPKTVNYEERKQAEKSFTPNRLTFNFSFITRDNKYNFQAKGFDKIVKSILVDKIIRLSTEQYTVIMNWPKSQGLEQLSKETLKKLSLNSEFVRSKRHVDCLDGYWIFRLSDKGRVVGKIQGMTYYVLAVDTTFTLYNHTKHKHGS